MIELCGLIIGQKDIFVSKNPAHPIGRGAAGIGSSLRGYEAVVPRYKYWGAVRNKLIGRKVQHILHTVNNHYSKSMEFIDKDTFGLKCLYARLL
jgi:hypothetical protein